MGARRQLPLTLLAAVAPVFLSACGGITTPDLATEAFGLYALSGKVASFMAPALIALATTISGSQRIGIAPLVVLFVIGLVLLSFVKPKGEVPA